MITGELKNKIDGIWDIFWSSGMTNPLTVIEQITYLMFIKILDAMSSARKPTQRLSIWRSWIPSSMRNFRIAAGVISAIMMRMPCSRT